VEVEVNERALNEIMSKANAHPAVSSGPLKNKLKAVLGRDPSVPPQKGVLVLRASLRDSSFCSVDDIVVLGRAEIGASDYGFGLAPLGNSGCYFSHRC
jgi:hypothetical protein